MAVALAAPSLIARTLGVRATTLRAWASLQRIAVYYDRSGRTLYDAEEVNRLMVISGYVPRPAEHRTRRRESHG